jgi:Protein of unknown function (DUF4197)
MDTFQEIAMRRSAAIILLAVLLSSCASFVDSFQQTAQVKFQQFLANQFGQRLQKGIDSVIGQLAMKGGFLDDPLVRILLPPPLGVAIGIARDLQKNPQAVLLETLLNQAAETTIPVAGPILKNIVMHMDEPSLEGLLDAGNTAATDYLKEKGGAVVQETLLPAITEELHLNGAVELYGKLLKARETVDQVTAKAADVQQQIETVQHQAAALQNVTQEQLGQYVAEQAMTGLFKKVADEELSIRETWDENKVLDIFEN